MTDIRKFQAIKDTGIETQRSIPLSCGCCHDIEVFFYEVKAGSVIEWDYDTDEMWVDGIEIEFEGHFPSWHDPDAIADITP